MFNVQRSVWAPYSDQQLFELVNDIKSYPKFMSGCVDAEVLRKGENWCEARLVLNHKGIRQSFTTRNVLQAPVRMNMSLVKGPFSHFEGCWRFDALSDDTCKVSLDLDFDFSNPLLKMTVGRQLEKIASRQVDELCQRAESVYGRPIR
ncbi:MAG: ribosome-associated toxin RatA of RatAB toxin-antitoxin module [Cellvibrionaceae bacterium]|jgi:ribosome-associated toxin RatA of RatAB toxin-antitoxin module